MECLRDKLRMGQWLIIAIAAYVVAFALSQIFPMGTAGAQVSTIFWKIGHITVAAHVGYWIDRGAFMYARLDLDSSDLQEIRRAIIIAAAVLAVAMGM